jgi:hypothetical protein
MLSEIEIQNYQLLIAILSFIVMLVTASWALYRFKKEGLFKPKIQFDIESKIVATQNNKRILKIFFILENKGLKTHKITELRYKILGLPKEGKPKRLDNHKHLVKFEEIEYVENIIPDSYKFFYIYREVRQRLHIVTDIEDKYSAILVRATLRYRYKINKHVIHTAENTFNLMS